MKKKKNKNKNKKNPIKFSKDDIICFSKKTLYKNFIKIKKINFSYRLFNGKMSKIISRKTLIKKNAVTTILYDPKLDKVVLIEQIRISTYENNITPWLIEIVAGIKESKETSETTSRRESLEETGITIKRCKKIMSYLSNPAGTNEKITLMIGEIDSSKAKGIHGLNKEDENIKLHIIKFSKALKWIKNGIINNSATIIALQYLQINHKTIKNKWK